MKKLIWKELREQFPVALLGLVVFTALLVVNFSDRQSAIRRMVFSYGYGSPNDCQPLLSDSVFMAAGFFCGIFGALLGFRQIFAERHPDLRAFLIHRPIELMAILRSKMIAGAVLYLIGAGLPLLGFIMACSRPGWVAAPFEWGMALPLTALGLSGLVFYAGGMLTALRKARWYVSKGCGLGLPVVVACGAVVLPEFWHALILIAVACLVQVLAVWGNFRTGGYDHGQPGLAKTGLVLTTTISATLVCGLIVVTVLQLVLWKEHSGWSQYQVTRDGEIIRVTNRSAGDVEVTDRDGKPFQDPVTGRPMDWKTVQGRVVWGVQTYLRYSDGQLERRFERGYARVERYFQALQVADKVLWYLTAEGKVIGFHGVTRDFVGEVRPPAVPAGDVADSNFQRSDSWSAGFQPGDSPIVLATARGLHRVDLIKREAQPLVKLPDDEAIVGLGISRNWATRETSNQVLIATMKFLRLVDYQGTVLFQIPYEPAPTLYPAATALTMGSPGGYLVRFDPDNSRNRESGGRMLTQIKRVNPDGSVGQVFELPKLPEPTVELAEWNVLAMFAPPAFTVAMTRLDARQTAMSVLPGVLMGIVFGAVGFGLARRNRTSAGATIRWTLFHLLFGLPGLLAYLAVHDRLARETCPGCRRPRVVNCEHCESCGAPFAAPARNGIEIFEPVCAVSR